MMKRSSAAERMSGGDGGALRALRQNAARVNGGGDEVEDAV
jgi:hypothetical protein